MSSHNLTWFEAKFAGNEDSWLTYNICQTNEDQAGAESVLLMDELNPKGPQ